MHPCGKKMYIEVRQNKGQANNGPGIAIAKASMNPKTMNRKKGFAALIVLLQICLPAFSQGWQHTDIYSKEGFEILLQQYQNAELLPIEERLRFFKAGTRAARHHQDKDWIRKFAYDAASNAVALDSLGTALEYINTARYAADESDAFTVNIISYQGVVHNLAGEYEAALGFFEEALELARNKYPEKVPLPLGNIAALYRSQQDYEKAIHYIYQVNQISLTLDSLGKAYNLVYDYAELCIVYSNLEQPDSATYYARLSIDNLNKIDKQLNMKAAAFAYITVADFYIDQLQQPDLAKPLLDSALYYTEGFYQTKVKVSIAKYFLATGNFPESGALIRELSSIPIQSQTTKLRLLELSKQYYAETGKFREALACADSIAILRSERFSQEKNRLTGFYAAKFKNQQQQQEIQALKYEKQAEQLRHKATRVVYILISLLACTVAILLGLEFSRKKRVANILRKELEIKTEDLKLTNKILADKVDKLNAFKYTVSHDLKTPISSAFNFLSLIKMETGDLINSSTSQLFINMDIALTQMKEIAEGVSAYLEADTLELHPSKIDCEKIVAGIFNQQKHLYPDHLKHYSFLIRSPLPDCYSDPLLFRQVLTNLLSNAIKAVQHKNHPEIQVYGQLTNKEVQLSIKDNGIGMPHQKRERIFALFKSVHDRKQFPGTGIGLAIVKRIMERHEGRIEVESPGEGQGSTFTLHFPLI